MSKPKFATALLAASLFGSGASSLIFEYSLATVSSHILSNSIYQFSLIVGIMMVSMGVAVYIQKFVGDDHLILKFAGIETLIALIGGFCPLIMYAVYATTPEHIVFFQYGLAASLGLLVGLEIPLVLRLNKVFLPDLKDNIASTFSWDYIGGFVGTLGWLFLLSRMPLNQIAFLAAGINFLVAFCTLAYLLRFKSDVNSHMSRFTKRGALALQVVVFATLVLGYTQAPKWSLTLESRLYEDPITFSQTTRYQHIVLTHNPKLDDVRCFINGNLQFSSVDEHMYHEQLVHPAMYLATKHGADKPEVLILGGGDGLAAREILKYPVQGVTLVDLDPLMTVISQTNPSFVKLNQNSLNDPKLQLETFTPHEAAPVLYDVMQNGPIEGEVEYVASVGVINVDAFKYIEQTKKPWDVIIVDFPDPNSVETAKLYSRAFYRHLLEHTPKGAIVAIQATSPYHAKDAYLCILKTVQSAGWEVLPYEDNIPSFGQWGWILAWKPESNLTHEGVIQDFLAQNAFDVPTSYLYPNKFLASTVFDKSMFTNADAIKVNTLQNPHLLQYYLRSWEIN
jgi:spermidine synthase